MQGTGIVAALMATAAFAEQPRFSFGVLADVQYADKDTAMGREYRKSPAKLSECTSVLNKEKLAFVIQLGDLMDVGLENLDLIGKLFGEIHGPKYHVLGNHDMDVPRSVFLKRMGMQQSYYQFSEKNWTFVVLDGMGESIAGGWPQGDPHESAGRKVLDKLRDDGAPNAQTWNGAVGSEQRQWLDDVLGKADERHDRVIVFCHFPVLPESCRRDHLLWDYQEVLKILESHPSVAAYMNGHDHKGGYGLEKGIHFLTLPGMVENNVKESCQVVDVYANSLIVRPAGAQFGRTLNLR